MFGKKHDAGKDRWDLLPVEPIRAVLKVLAFGAKLYGEHNWQLVANAKSRYYAAALRHLTDYFCGQRIDKDSGLPTLAHAACDVLFLLWFDLKEVSDGTTVGEDED